jgi:hypothetical protein
MHNLLFYTSLFALGWMLGSGLMWFHFYHSGLIRSREEYYKAKAQGRRSME